MPSNPFESGQQQQAPAADPLIGRAAQLSAEASQESLRDARGLYADQRGSRDIQQGTANATLPASVDAGLKFLADTGKDRVQRDTLGRPAELKLATGGLSRYLNDDDYNKYTKNIFDLQDTNEAINAAEGVNNVGALNRAIAAEAGKKSAVTGTTGQATQFATGGTAAAAKTGAAAKPYEHQMIGNTLYYNPMVDVDAGAGDGTTKKVEQNSAFRVLNNQRGKVDAQGNAVMGSDGRQIMEADGSVTIYNAKGVPIGTRNADGTMTGVKNAGVMNAYLNTQKGDPYTAQTAYGSFAKGADGKRGNLWYQGGNAYSAVKDANGNTSLVNSAGKVVAGLNADGTPMGNVKLLRNFASDQNYYDAQDKKAAGATYTDSGTAGGTATEKVLPTDLAGLNGVRKKLERDQVTFGRGMEKQAIDTESARAADVAGTEVTQSISKNRGMAERQMRGMVGYDPNKMARTMNSSGMTLGNTAMLAGSRTNAREGARREVQAVGDANTAAVANAARGMGSQAIAYTGAGNSSNAAGMAGNQSSFGMGQQAGAGLNHGYGTAIQGYGTAGQLMNTQYGNQMQGYGIDQRSADAAAGRSNNMLGTVVGAGVTLY